MNERTETESAPVSCVISSWNKIEDLRGNLMALRRQRRPPAQVIVVDNHSSDGSQQMVREDFPEVELIEMESSEHGACETFNLGFWAAKQPFVAILDDDVVLPPDWMETLLARFEREPASTAILTTKVVEPKTPESYLRLEEVSKEQYLCTFRGCGSLARREVLVETGGYDERFFIYGNERDLAARVLSAGHRILLVPEVITFHGTPFGIKAGKRSLYFHARNFWLYAFKNCRWRDVVSVGWRLGMKALGGGKKKSEDDASEATGTIGLQESVKQTPGGLWIAIKATLAAVAMLPYCLRHRKVCTAPDFRLPLQ